MRIYCTLFDGGYIARGVVLANSLNEHCSPCMLYILCMDDDALVLLEQLKIPNVIPISLSNFEQDDSQLAGIKKSRSTVEYYFSCKASLIKYVLNINPGCERVSYLDADLFFFSDPLQLDKEIAEHSVAVIEHRFSPSNMRLYKYGRFNAGWLSIRNDITGRQSIEWWRNQCLEWCYDYVENDRYADQKYLDRFPELFDSVIVKNIGANLAPWNIGNYKIKYNNDKLFVDGLPVIFFHFQGVKRLWGEIIESGFASYRQPLSTIVRDHMFYPYMTKWFAAEIEVNKARQELNRQENYKNKGVNSNRVKRGSFLRRLRIMLTSIIRNVRYKTLFVFNRDSNKI